MTYEPSVPPLRDLPRGCHAARRAHLLAEITRTPTRLARGRVAVAVVAAVAGVAGGLQVASSSSGPRGARPAAVPGASCLVAPQLFYGCSRFLRAPDWLARAQP